jgi:hypothetical protein
MDRTTGDERESNNMARRIAVRAGQFFDRAHVYFAAAALGWALALLWLEMQTR